MLPISPRQPPLYVFISIRDWPASVQVAGASISHCSGEQNGWNGSFISFGRCWHAVMLENRVTALDGQRGPGQGFPRCRRSDEKATSQGDRWSPLDSGECQGRWWRGAGDGPGSRRRATAGQRCFRAGYPRDEVPSISVERNVAEGLAGIDGEELLNIYWAQSRLSLQRCCAQEKILMEIRLCGGVLIYSHMGKAAAAAALYRQLVPMDNVYVQFKKGLTNSNIS